MPNLASIIKSEISRMARKEIRAEVTAIKKISATQRAHIAELKRQVHQLQQQVKGLQKSATVKPTQAAETTDATTPRKFNAQAFAAHRQLLGLSAADCGLLVGASGLSVYKWEKGVMPRAKNLAAIAAFRKMGKRQAKATLAELKVSSS